MVSGQDVQLIEDATMLAEVRGRSLWEDARVRLATQPHTPIHRWTHDGPHCA